ncbi:MAG: DUF2567 domain-containing protein [Aldersonia sp.]|nr:DUF2567 domain-containing protein [Aldersonia sp.]
MSRTEVRHAARVVLAGVGLGVLGGIGWAFLAPTQQVLVVAADRGAPLTGESMHEFDSVAIFACISAIVGLLLAVGAWRMTRARGPILFAGILLGSAVGAATMAVVGEGVARLRHPRVDAPQVHDVVALAPGIGTMLVLIVAPLLASSSVLVMATLNSHDDLGTPATPPTADTTS